MVAAWDQRWFTYASNDVEARKSILLVRSLRKVFTTRPVGVFFSDHVSEPIRELLQEEFDMSFRLGCSKLEVFKGMSFSAAARFYAWTIRGIRKFVFLDCDTLVWKNMDELFRRDQDGIIMDGRTGTICSVIGIKTSDCATTTGCVQKRVMDYDKGLLDVKGLLEAVVHIPRKYVFSIDLSRGLPTPMDGQGFKLLHFTSEHPLDFFFNKSRNSQSTNLEKMLRGFCEELVHEQGRGSFEQSTNPSKQKPNYEYLSDSVAIVGIACRFPGATTLDEFWDMLEKGQEGICRVPEGRWTKDNSIIRLMDVRNTEAGFLPCPIDRFDAKFFNVNQADLEFTDPQQRMTMQIVWEALEHAGVNPQSLKNSLTGVFGGWWRNDYKEMIQQIGVNETDVFRAYMGNALGTLTARISHFLELSGPSVSTESGCSTSIVGVDLACESLRNEKCDVALAVGANLLLHPFSINMMNTVIAMNGRCKTFDAEADGFGRAEGVAVLVLKRFPDAVANGDRIWGVIRGSAVVQEGISKSMGTPTAESEALAMQIALDRAGVRPDEVSFVETHGTGTPVGDPLEVAAMAKVYSKGRKEPLTIGSVKTNIGHTESVCGIAGIIKTILSMQHEIIPRHLNFNTLNPEINLEAIPARIPLENIEWKKVEGKPRIAGVSSFGITGTDAHLIMEEPPVILPSSKLPSDSRPLHLLTISAKSEDTLKQQLAAYQEWLKLKAETDLDLKDIEYSMHTGRPHFAFRQTFIANDIGGWIRQIGEEIEHPGKVQQIPNVVPKLCFLFTGQGSQYSGMAKWLYENSVVFRTHFDYCNTILMQQHRFSLKEALWDSDQFDLLKRTLYSQTSIFCLEYCLLKLWESWGILPHCVLGHSLGEFTAAVAAGMIDFEDALTLVVTRSKLIDSLPNAGMVVIAAELSLVEEMLKKIHTAEKNGFWLDIAAVNSKEQTVLAGPRNYVEKIVDFCKNNNIRSHVLDASHAFHSRLMEPMLKEYKNAASRITYHEPREGCQYISGMEGKIVNTFDPDYWIKHTRDRVRFLEASKTALEGGNCLFLEVGPHPILSVMIMINSDAVDVYDPIFCLPSLRKKQDDCEVILGSLSNLYCLGFPINWENFHRFSNAKKVDIPRYRLDEKPYWMAIRDSGVIPFHPLLGGFISNPSPTKIFRNELSPLRVPFLRDHCLDGKLIFPGAGFMEMCLTAGYAATHCVEGLYIKPSTRIAIQKFSICSPVLLSEKSSTECQVVVTRSHPEDSGEEVNVIIYTRLQLEAVKSKWIRHAAANFISMHLGNDEVLPTLDAVRSICSEHVSSKYSYKDLEEHGYNFGRAFKNITTAWKGNGEEKKDDVLFEFETEENVDPFIVHPCVIDSMFQAQMISMGIEEQNKDKPHYSKVVFVPLQVESFTCYAPLTTKSGYIYVKPTTSTVGEKDTFLYDADGQLVATMLGTEFVETTVNNIMAMIQSQRNPYPGMYDYRWRDELGPFEKVVNLTGFDMELDKETDFNTFTDEEEEFYQSSNYLFALYMIQSLIKLGFEEYAKKRDRIVSWPEAGKELGIVPDLNKFFRYIMMELSQEGLLEMNVKDEEQIDFKILKRFRSASDVSAEIQRLNAIIRSKGMGEKDVTSVEPVGQKLYEILTGQISALSVLFPEGTNTRGPAEIYYNDSYFHEKCEFVGQHYLPQIIERCLEENSQQPPNAKPILRILEVGAGTGSATKGFISGTEKNKGRYEYTYTDVSLLFLQMGQQLFEGKDISAKFKLLNIEEDPLTQGFVPNHYDIILASFVIHATKDVKTSVKNLRKLLKPNGYILLHELTYPNRAINLLFGGLEQFWGFTDFNIRPHNCELSAEKWDKDVFQQCGFDNCFWRYTFDSRAACIGARADENFQVATISGICVAEKVPNWIIFGEEGPLISNLVHKLEVYGRKVVLLKLSDFNLSLGQGDTTLEKGILSALRKIDGNQSIQVEGIAYLYSMDCNLTHRDICEPYLYICKYLVQRETPTKLVTFTRGNMTVGPQDFPCNFPHASPVIGMTKALMNEAPNMFSKLVDLDDSEEMWEEGFAELFMNDAEKVIAYREHRRNFPRLVKHIIVNSALEIPATQYYRMILPINNMIPDLKFGAYKPQPIEDDEVEVQVKAYGLNFRDLMAVIKPDPVFQTFNSVGIDYAGVVTAVGSNVEEVKVGDRVASARVTGDAMPSYLTVKGKFVLKIPEDMTFCDAATLPAAFTTVGLCLVELTRLREEDVILIHTATGGVGLAAIYLAQLMKCTIIATAGNERKRNYLKRLGIKHVFNSRTTEFENGIKAALNGRGVDVVLNSLTGQGFKEASLSVCNEGARFIEMSKMNIWTKEEVAALRPDVKYEIVDLSEMTAEEGHAYYEKFKKEFEEKKKVGAQLRHLPYTRFELADVRDALEFMQKAKHIGKIVVAMPGPSTGISEIPKSNIFNENSFYLITGGLGGIGLSLANWMANNGARHILLVGRTVPSKESQAVMNEMSAAGVNVTFRQCDIGNMDECKSMMKEMGFIETVRSTHPNEQDSLDNPFLTPPLRGIFHAAGVLSDGTFDKQCWEKYESVFNAKVKGSWNLHQLSLEMDYPLEHFVLFSSAVATLGSLAQGNHAAGNTFLDSLAHYRNSLGLPALSINWGQWGQVGVAANLTVPGFSPFTVLQGMAALEYIIKSHVVESIVIDADFSLVRKAFESTKQLLIEIEDREVNSFKELNEEKFWTEYDSTTTFEEKYEVLKRYIKTIIRINLKLDKNYEIDDHLPFQDLGMDSLMMVEMKNGLQSSVGRRVKISISQVKDCKTVHSLSTRLVELISGKEEGPPPTPEELRELIIQDSVLPEEIITKCKESCQMPIKHISQVQTVLITGCTGTLGPYIIRDLCKLPTIAKIYCLMRETKIFSPRERLRKVCSEKKLLDEIDFDKLDFVIGDVSKPNFGIAEEVYSTLVQDVDAIIHFAVKASFDEFYAASDAPNHSRTINVVGIRNVLLFAATKKLKYLYHASTMIAENLVDESGAAREDWPIEGEFDNRPNCSYPISKFICERLASQAVNCGIPCKVFRFPNVGGDTKRGGNFQVLDNHLMMRFLAYMRMGFMPALNVPMSILPVDTCAKISVSLFFRDDVEYGVFNVANPHVADELEFENLAKEEFRIQIDVIDPEDALDRLKKVDVNDEILQIARMGLIREKELRKHAESEEDHLPDIYHNWLAGNKKVLLSKKLCKYVPSDYPNGIPPTVEILKRDLHWAKDNGIFDKFDIKYNIQ